MTSAGHQAHHPPHKSVTLAILLTCVGYAMYNINDAGLKILTLRLHFSEIMLISSLMIISFMTAYGWLKEGRRAFRTSKPRQLLARAAIAQVTGFCNIMAFPHIHLTTFYTLVFTVPFWVALLSAYFLRDRLGASRMGVILFGFCVILFIFRPGGEMYNVWSLLVLVGSFAYACQMVLVRHIGPGESRPFMFMWGSAMTILLVLPFVGSHFVMPTLQEWALFLLMGLTGSIGLLSVGYAFQVAPSASTVAPYHYTQIIWGALLGYFLFNETPGTEIMIGAVLIIVAGLYLIHHETRRAALRPMEV